MYNLESAEAELDRHSNILPGSYKKAYLPSCIQKHLAAEEQEDLFCLLEIYEDLKKGNLG